EVLDHGFAPVVALGRPLAVAVSARIESDDPHSGGGQLGAGLLPRMPGLPAAVQEDHQRTVGGSVLVGSEFDPARTAQAQPDGIDEIVRTTHDLRIAQSPAGAGTNPRV